MTAFARIDKVGPGFLRATLFQTLDFFDPENEPQRRAHECASAYSR